MIPDLRDAGATAPDGDAAAEALLWRAWREGYDALARERLVLLHLPYARAIAARLYSARRSLGIEFADYYQLACIGLLESMDRFDPGREVAFRTFCTRRVEGSILNGLHRLSEASEQVSLHRRMQRERLHSLRERPAAARGVHNTLAELSEVAVGLAIGFMLDETAMVLAEGDAAGADTGYTTLAWRQARDRVAAAVRSLPERERQVVVLHYFHGLTFEHVGVVFGLTKGRISQIHGQALRRLRELLGPADRFSLMG